MGDTCEFWQDIQYNKCDQCDEIYVSLEIDGDDDDQNICRKCLIYETELISKKDIEFSDIKNILNSGNVFIEDGEEYITITIKKKTEW